MAPEVLCAKNHSYAVDFFAIGIMGYEFMFGERPYQGDNRKQIKKAVLARQVKITVDQIPKGWSWDSVDFFNLLMKRKQEQRLGYKKGIIELKEHAWFKGFDWVGLENKTLPSPFIPGQSGNFDRSYCEGTDLLGEDTLCRYEDYMDRESFEREFANYSYIDENEVNKYLLPQSRNEQLHNNNNNNNIATSNGDNNTSNNTNSSNKTSFKLLQKVRSYSNFPQLYSPQHKLSFMSNYIDNPPLLKKNLSNNNINNFHRSNNNNNNNSNNNSNNILSLNEESKTINHPPFNKPLLLRINSPNNKRIFDNSIFKPKSPVMKSSNSILLLSSKSNNPKNDFKNQTLSIKVPHNYGILPSPIRNTNQNQINTTKRHNQESQQVSKENNLNVIHTKDKANKIMNKLSKKIMLEDYLFIKNNNNKRDLPILKRGSSVDYNGISGMSHNSNANISEKKRMMLPITINQKLLNKFESPKFVSQLHHYTKALKYNNKVSCNSKHNNSHKDNSVKNVLQSAKRKKSASVQEKGNKK